MTTAVSVPSSPHRRRIPERLIAGFLGGGFIVGALIVWQLLASLRLVNTFLSSSPALVAKSLYEQAASGLLLRSLAASAFEFSVGFAAAAVIGVVVGLLMGRYRYVEYAIDPYVWLLYSAPVIAMFPLMVLLLGLGRPTVIFITFLLCIVPVIVNTTQGVRNVDKQLVQAAVSFGASEVALLRKVILPASVPTIMAGIRLAIGRALVGVIVGEFFAGDAGLGYDISFYAGRLNTSAVFASVFVVVVAGLFLNFVARRVESLADSWRVDIK
jgi:ABC-type nitrate/sulfonate/bicarbonate transport system permease component